MQSKYSLQVKWRKPEKSEVVHIGVIFLFFFLRGLLFNYPPGVNSIPLLFPVLFSLTTWCFPEQSACFLQEECKPHALSKCARVHSHFLCSREPGAWAQPESIWSTPWQECKGLRSAFQVKHVVVTHGAFPTAAQWLPSPKQNTRPALKGFYSKKHKMHQKYSQRLLQTKQTKQRYSFIIILLLYLHGIFKPGFKCTSGAFS